jgi:hypothetical protein
MGSKEELSRLRESIAVRFVHKRVSVCWVPLKLSVERCELAMRAIYVVGNQRRGGRWTAPHWL